MAMGVENWQRRQMSDMPGVAHSPIRNALSMNLGRAVMKSRSAAVAD
jgi:hypothetical protein